MVMNSIKQAQGRGVSMMAMGLAFALTVNAAFGLVLAKASTNGQRYYNAWFSSSNTMMADASVAQHRISKG
jgi:biopolymer transport protein ExbB/TolQ